MGFFPDTCAGLAGLGLTWHTGAGISILITTGYLLGAVSLPDDTLVLCSGQWNLIARTTEVQSKNNITGICTQKDCLAFLH